MATKSISQLTTAAAVDNSTLFEVATPDVGSASGYVSEKISEVQLADHTANDVVFPDVETTAQSLVGAINEVLGTTLTDTLTAVATSLVFSDASITTSSTIDIYTNIFGVNPTNVTVATGSVTLTFEAQITNVGVKIIVK